MDSMGVTVAIDWVASTAEKISHIKEKVSSGKFPMLLDEYQDGIDMLSIRAINS